MKFEPESQSRDDYRIEVLKLVVAVFLLPLLPLAVATNFLGTGDQLSLLPGIKRGGGLGSAVVTLVYVVVLIGAVTGAVAVATSGDVPVVGSTEPTQTPTATPSSTPTRTPTPTSPTGVLTPTPTPTPSDAELHEEYEGLQQQYLEHWSGLDVEHPATPELLGTDVPRDQDALWVVFDETDVHENASRMRDEWTTVANAYLHSLDSHAGQAPERMIAVGWNNTGPITYFRVETDTAQALIDGDIEYNTFYNRFFQSIKPTTEGERRLARDIAEHPPDDN